MCTMETLEDFKSFLGGFNVLCHFLYTIYGWCLAYGKSENEPDTKRKAVFPRRLARSSFNLMPLLAWIFCFHPPAPLPHDHPFRRYVSPRSSIWLVPVSALQLREILPTTLKWKYRIDSLKVCCLLYVLLSARLNQATWPRATEQ